MLDEAKIRELNDKILKAAQGALHLAWQADKHITRQGVIDFAEAQGIVNAHEGVDLLVAIADEIRAP